MVAVALAGHATAQPTSAFASAKLTNLAAELQAGRVDAIQHFLENARGKLPLVEPIPDDDTAIFVTFIWRGGKETQRVDLIGGMPITQPKQLTRLLMTDLWFWTERIPKDARFGYGFVENVRHGKPSKVLTDPLNARQYAEQSVVELPAAPPQPWSERIEGIPGGTRTAFKIKSEFLNEERGVTVYVPAGYDSKAGDNNLLVVFDGESCGGDLIGFNPIPSNTILDNLIAKKKLPPTIGVFVESAASRDRDLGCHPPFADFVAKELVPWIRAHYRVTDDPRRTMVAGFSRGGLGAAFVAWKHPEIIGNVLAMSGAFWWHPDADADDRVPPVKRPLRKLARESGWLTRQLAISPRVPVRFWIEAGRFEDGIRAESRRLRDVLDAKGCTVIYREYNGDHDYVTWRGSLANGLIDLWARPQP
jgi:enterochelin esterase family protein